MSFKHLDDALLFELESNDGSSPMSEPLPEVVVSPSVDALSDAVGKRLFDLVQASKQDVFTIALSGGSLPKLLANGLLKYKDEIDFSKWRVFYADERFVHLNHADSNYKASKTYFLDKLPIKDEHVIKINTSLSLEKSAEDYEQRVKEICRKKTVGAAQVPVFDLILLGMGPDGHTCSLFPGHKLLGETNKMVIEITDSPKPPPKRITLTYPVLNNADNVWFLAAGDGKKDMLPKVVISQKKLREEGDKALPSARVRPSSGNLVWFVDAPAAVNLKGSSV